RRDRHGIRKSREDARRASGACSGEGAVMTDETLKDRCPTCGAAVASIFDHIGRDCENDEKQTPREKLIDLFEAGEMGPVEFTEEALALDFTMEEIGKILESGQDIL